MWITTKENIVPRNLNKMLWQDRYNRYLRTDHWRKVRTQVFNRDKGQCVMCRQELTIETMVCHHISYRLYNKLGQADPYECRTLCHHCHALMHGHLKKDDAIMERVLKSIRKSKR